MALSITSMVVAGGNARAAVTFFSSEASWTSTLDSIVIQSFHTTAGNLALADEQPSPPVPDEALGGALTLRASITGLCEDIQLRTYEAGAGFTFDDGEPAPPLFGSGTISIGDVGDFSNDDFGLHFTSHAIHGVAINLVDNIAEAGERLDVFGASGLLASLDASAIADGEVFIGIVADEAITSIRFEEHSGPDDIGLDALHVACANKDGDIDGMANIREHVLGSDPADSDHDGDGLTDGEEIALQGFATAAIISNTAAGAFAVTTGDMDGDGDIDVLSANRYANSVVWYENTDSLGNFGAPHTIAAAVDGPVSVVAADLDGDLDLDVLTTLASGDAVAWYENTDGAGNFGTQQLITTAVDTPFSVFAADFDDDGDLDVVSGSRHDNKVAWYENTDGQGTFGPQQIISSSVTFATSVFASDLDGDGDQDILSASNTQDLIAWYENTDGAGSFVGPMTISNQANFAWSVYAADLDGDGDNDVLSASSSDNKIAWYENTDGAGTFGPQLVLSSTAMGARTVFAADLDGDGDRDVLASCLDLRKFVWYENLDGQGSFGPQIRISGKHTPARWAVAADLDGDGDADIATASSGVNTVGWFAAQSLSDPLNPDSDGDGLTDLDEIQNHGTDPWLADTDDDGLGDLEELATYFTDPLDRDSDDDWIPDGVEVAAGTDPNDPESSPPASVPAIPPIGHVLLPLGWMLIGIRTVIARRTSSP